MSQHPQQGIETIENVAAGTFTWAALAARFGLKSAQGPHEALEKTRQAFELIAQKTGLPEHLAGLGASVSLFVQGAESTLDELSLRSTQFARWDAQTETLVAPASLDGIFSAWHAAAEGWLVSSASPSKNRSKQLIGKLDTAIEALPAAAQLERTSWVEWPLNRAHQLTDALLEKAGAPDSLALGRRLARQGQANEKPLAVSQAAAHGVEGLSLSGEKKEALAALWREAVACRAARSRFAERNRDSKRLSAFSLAAVAQDERDSHVTAEKAPSLDTLDNVEEMLSSSRKSSKSQPKAVKGATHAATPRVWSDAAALRSRAAQTFFVREKSEAAQRHCELFLLPCEQEATRLAPIWTDFWRHAAPLLAEALSQGSPSQKAGAPMNETIQPATEANWMPPASINMQAKSAERSQIQAPVSRARAPA